MKHDSYLHSGWARRLLEPAREEEKAIIGLFMGESGGRYPIYILSTLHFNYRSPPTSGLYQLKANISRFLSFKSTFPFTQADN